ncbi:hypothetical protein PILCRDRAFT_729683 [Piloderma croceum F 1598]|uniref:Zn(2)-C6 fungal-type domain-containing protein n=1 Tax=Piloderma croceum (strain F 1598) TaxID=765440 RepID=A0A0C3F005_PILCF|nr:hypothetical protein PILCRDRAFT_729683 [Piloderma croceum F 1598]
MWKSHKPTCKAAQAHSPSTSSDPISKLTERINAARFQQSRTRQFSTFITPQDVISAAEKSYKDATRDAETLLRCEPEYSDELVGDQKWIDERWEWVDLCEKILGKGQAALQTLNIFQKKLEVPPILIGSDGSFVGQSKKTVKELIDKYSGESTDNLQTLDSSTCITDGDLNLCSRCRTRGMVCDGKKGRACAPCKKSKLSCNLSSTRVSAAKSKDALKNSAGANSVAHAVMTRPRTSERSSTPIQRKLESWVESYSAPDAVLNGMPANPNPLSCSAHVDTDLQRSNCETVETKVHGNPCYMQRRR